MCMYMCICMGSVCLVAMHNQWRGPQQLALGKTIMLIASVKFCLIKKVTKAVGMGYTTIMMASVLCFCVIEKMDQSSKYGTYHYVGASVWVFLCSRKWTIALCMSYISVYLCTSQCVWQYLSCVFALLKKWTTAGSMAMLQWWHLYWCSCMTNVDHSFMFRLSQYVCMCVYVCICMGSVCLVSKLNLKMDHSSTQWAMSLC